MHRLKNFGKICTFFNPKLENFSFFESNLFLLFCNVDENSKNVIIN